MLHLTPHTPLYEQAGDEEQAVQVYAKVQVSHQEEACDALLKPSMMISMVALVIRKMMINLLSRYPTVAALAGRKIEELFVFWSRVAA